MNVTVQSVRKFCSRPCFVRPVIVQNTARFRISLRNSRRTTVAGESFFACSTPSVFRSRFFRRIVENLKVAYEIAITRRKLTIPSFQPGEVSVHRRLYTEADGPKGPLFVHLSCSSSYVFPRASNPKKRSYILRSMIVSSLLCSSTAALLSPMHLDDSCLGNKFPVWSLLTCSSKYFGNQVCNRINAPR